MPARMPGTGAAHSIIPRTHQRVSDRIIGVLFPPRPATPVRGLRVEDSVDAVRDLRYEAETEKFTLLVRVLPDGLSVTLISSR